VLSQKLSHFIAAISKADHYLLGFACIELCSTFRFQFPEGELETECATRLLICLSMLLAKPNTTSKQLNACFSFMGKAQAATAQQCMHGSASPCLCEGPAT
jgi:hypothetical protein